MTVHVVTTVVSRELVERLQGSPEELDIFKGILQRRLDELANQVADEIGRRVIEGEGRPGVGFIRRTD
jgi:hypothetical protein